MQQSKEAKDRPAVKTAKWKGITIELEFIKGSYRHGRELPMHYGYFPDSMTDDDGDHVDVFLTADPYKADVAFIINQMKPTGAFDEHKILLGFANAQDAKEEYLKCYNDDFTGFGSIVAVTPYQLQWWLENGDLTSPVDPLDFLPNGKAIKRAMDFTPDYTPTDLARFGLMQPHRKTAWHQWYDGYVQGIRTPVDESRVEEWRTVVRKHASAICSNYAPQSMDTLVLYAVDPFTLLPRSMQKKAQDFMAERWKKYADVDKPIIAVDLDGTLAETLPVHDDAKIGPVKKDMALLVNGLQKLGCIICIWTVRDSRHLVASHLKDAGVVPDYVNDSPFNPESGSRKIYADVYLDDRGVRAEGPAHLLLRRIVDILRTEGKLP